MSKFRSRFVELAEPRARAAARNSPTVFASYRATDRGIDFRRLFLAHYERIRATCMEFAEPGLAVFAIDPHGGWEATMCLPSRAGEIRAGVVGRHSEAHLFIGDDPTIALRHLLFVVEPPCSLRHALRGEVRFRLLDLNTGSPPIDEEGRAVESLTAEGPVFLNCQDHAIMAFITGDPTDWPESASDAWACIPERVFVEERLAPAAAGSGASPLPGGPGQRRMPVELRRITTVRSHDGPVHVAARLACEDEVVHGNLMIRSGEQTEIFRVGRESLRRGVLVGRYERCQASERNAIEDSHVSRVHLMVIEIVGQPCAIDLASSNGSYCVFKQSGEFVRFQITQLEEGLVVAVGSTNTCIGWAAAPPADHDEEVYASPAASGVPRVVVKQRKQDRRRARNHQGAFNPPGVRAADSDASGHAAAARPSNSKRDVARSVAPSNDDSIARRAPSPPPRLSPTEFLRQQSRYLEATLLERLAWETYYIPLALALLERGGSATLEQAGVLVPFPAGGFVMMARALNGDGLGIFDPNCTTRVSLLSHINAILATLRR